LGKKFGGHATKETQTNRNEVKMCCSWCNCKKNDERKGGTPEKGKKGGGNTWPNKTKDGTGEITNHLKEEEAKRVLLRV